MGGSKNGTFCGVGREACMLNCKFVGRNKILKECEM